MLTPPPTSASAAAALHHSLPRRRPPDMISPGQAATMEYFVPRSVSDFNLPALSETSLNNASSTIIPPPPLVEGSQGPLPSLVGGGGGRMCSTTPRRMPSSEQRILGVGREKMVTFEDDLAPTRKLAGVEDVFM